MTAYLRIAGQDVSAQTIYDVTAESGRDDIEAQPDSSVMNARLVALPESLDIGAPVELSDSFGIMFHGWITDIQAELDPADMIYDVSITATGPLAQLGHADAGQTIYPQESDSQRIVRVIDPTGIGYQIDPGIVGPALLARAPDPAKAEALARSAADDGMGVLWEDPRDPLTPLRYTPQRLRKWSDYRLAWSELPAAMTWADFPGTWAEVDTGTLPAPPGTPPELTLDPAVTLAQATFTRRIGDYARTVTVAYGVKPEEGDRPTVTVGEGIPAREYETELALADDANHYATDMLRRVREPGWRLSNLRVPLHKVPNAEEIRAALTVGTRLTVPFPLGSPVGPIWHGFLEGWKHTLTGEATAEWHYIDLRTSARSMTEPSDRWTDIPQGLTWGQTDPGMRWIDATDWKGA